MRLTLFRDSGKSQQIFTFSEAPDGKSDYVNHAEAELLLQRLDQM